MPGFDVNTTSGNRPNPSESGYFEFGTDKQAIRPFRINSDGSIQFGASDGSGLDTTLSRTGSGILLINGDQIGTASSISAVVSAAVAVETARAQAAEALALPKTGGTMTGLLTANAGITATGTVSSGQLTATTGLTIPTGANARNFNQLSRWHSTVAQTAIVDGTSTVMLFDTADSTDAPVTMGTGANGITAGNVKINTAGTYQIASSRRLQAGTTVATTSFELTLAVNGATIIDDDGLKEAGNSGQIIPMVVCTTRKLAVNDLITVIGTVTGSGAWATNPVSEREHLAITFLGP